MPATVDSPEPKVEQKVPGKVSCEESVISGGNKDLGTQLLTRLRAVI